MESPAHRDHPDADLLAGFDIPDLVADIDGGFLLQPVLLEQVEKGPVLSEEILLGMNEIEDVEVPGPQELQDVLGGIGGQDPQPEAAGLEIEDELADAGKDRDLPHPLMQLFLGHENDRRDFEQRDLEAFDDVQVRHPPQLLHVLLAERLDVELRGVLVDEADDNRQGVGDRPVEIKNDGFVRFHLGSGRHCVRTFAAF